MEEFAVKSFAKKPSLLMLDSLKKVDLLAIAQHYKLSLITSSQKKGEIKKLIKDYLIDEELVPKDEELPLPSTGLLDLFLPSRRRRWINIFSALRILPPVLSGLVMYGCCCSRVF